MSVINFKCKKCRREFDGDVGKVTFPPEAMRPVFEKEITCPRCGTLTMNDVELTEFGQTQMTQLDFDQADL
ncbi:MAG: hypothetical protein IH991_19045 [Planctomycetes bacterium]|nr:hypothetical protein [Planctomycetota bacterium]